jgi:hypothetical protein
MISRMFIVNVLVVFALGATIVRAQQPAAPAMPTIPAPSCVKPEVPRTDAVPQRVTIFNRDYKTYGECVKKYVDETNALASAAIAAGKTVIEEFNALGAEIRARDAAK